jgi:hypothetical protein
MVMIKRRDRSSIFAGPKSACAIPARNPLLRDAVIQASFDQSVTSIDFVRCTNVAGQIVVLNAVVITKNERLFELDVVGARAVGYIGDKGLRLLALEQLNIVPLELSEADIRCEPRCSTAREIWRHKSIQIPSCQSLAILDAIDGCGPQTIAELDGKHSGHVATLTAVFSLVATGMLSVDIDKPMGLRTVVRRNFQGKRMHSTKYPNANDFMSLAGGVS